MLPQRFRKLSIESKRRTIEDLPTVDSADFASTGESEELKQLSDVLVESAVGYFGVPLGIADGFLIDGTTYHVPLATEEPSVIAAATYAAKITGTSGGFTAWSDRPVMNGTVYFADRPNLREQISERTGEIERLLNEQFSTMKKRGGGYRGVEITGIGGYVKIRFDVDVCDAMGANAINSAAEKLGGFLSERIGETPILSILTNAATSRRSGAQFTIDPRNIVYAS